MGSIRSYNGSDVIRKQVFFGTIESMKFFLGVERNRDWVAFQDCCEFLAGLYPHAWDVRGMVNRAVNNKKGEPAQWEHRPRNGIVNGEIRYVGKALPDLPRASIQRSAEYWESLTAKQQESLRLGKGLVEDDQPKSSLHAGDVWEFLGNMKDGSSLLRDGDKQLWTAVRL